MYLFYVKKKKKKNPVLLPFPKIETGFGRATATFLGAHCYNSSISFVEGLGQAPLDGYRIMETWWRLQFALSLMAEWKEQSKKIKSHKRKLALGGDRKEGGVVAGRVNHLNFRGSHLFDRLTHAG